MASSDKVKVAVRVRPFNRREKELVTKCVVDMESEQTILYHPSIGVKESNEATTPHGGSKKAPKTFAFDHCFWSMDKAEKKFAGQETVFNCLGMDILQRAFEGYNACIFAYGQTGSGKSYSMMGTFEEKGIIPRLCDSLFDQIAGNTDSTVEYKVEVSYMEIYNERVRDLLDPKGKHNLKVREHNILGPYVDGLSTLAVSSFQDIDNLMSEGNKSRTVAATNMNSESSRSHAVFNIILTATMTDTQSGVSGEKVSKMSLVDLAGSERAQKTGAVGDRLKEGSNINKSLTTLGLVISALADSSSRSGKNKFVPYRDSVLTWLLKDNLGGNSKTVMVATVSPSADNYEETLSTLRYADRAKRIINHAVVNEDPNARIIRELREEVEMLRTMLGEAQSHKQDGVREKLEESEKLVGAMSKTWEQKLQETEKIHQERQQTLEKMGISVQTSGIKVEVGKYYLVNLNADPSLNELLVYYLKERTLVGRPGAAVEQDIQLNGLGVKSEHAVIEIEEAEVYVTPLPDTRTCVNGKTITERTKCKHSDRLLLGNYHFFRINCPKTNSPSAETPQNIDIEFAQRELMQQEMGNDPIQTAISDLEKEHEKDKEEALQKQRQMYEWEMQKLKKALMSPGTPSAPYPPFFPDAFRTPTGQPAGSSTEKYNSWAEEKDRMFKQSLQKLKAEVLKANTLVREANFLAQEMGKQTNFSVTLQIPAANLTPNRKRGAFVSEPAILVKHHGKGSQVWAMDKFENKIIDMRDMFEDKKERGTLLVEDDLYSEDTPIVVRNGIVVDHGPVKGDPFIESQENHNLIGVANVFLEALFYDTKLSYSVPIISQQGEIAGKLHVELGRVAGNFPQDRQGDADSDGSLDGSRVSLGDGEEESAVAMGSSIVARVCILSARGLPPALANFVFCQYSFWNHPDPVVVAPIVNPDIIPKSEGGGTSFKFDHKKEIVVSVTEEFVEHCTDGALSIEVWGHRSAGFGRGLSWEPENVQAKHRSIMDRWSELSRKLELWAEIHELNEQGEYVPVELSPKPEVFTGGVFQLRQGHSRRILVHVKPVQNSGTLPLIVEGIQHVSIGCVTARSRLQKGLDSYQEEDLSVLRGRWSDALEKRREYLDQQLQSIMSKDVKTDSDKERERSLIDQWVCLTEERNAVLVPAAGSGIPGAPADWEPPSGMEEHVPVIFLDLNAEDMSTPTAREGLQAAGVNSILPKEHNTKFFVLPFVQNSERNITALVSWDSSIHDSVHLNRITPSNERVYLVLKVVVRLSHPAAMELVLRKRVCINVYKRQSITEKLKKRISKAVWYSVGAADYLQDTLVGSAVTYEIVSNIPKIRDNEIVSNVPKASEDLEDRESLAQMAASQQETSAADGETYIEKYIKGVSAVESILMLDRLRQEVAMKELMTNRGKSLSMRKATSVPNINSILSPGELRAGSTSDLSEFNPERHGAGGLPKQFSLDALRQRSLADSRDKSFSLARPNFLNLRPNMHTMKSPGSGSGKLVKPMGTLLEEQQSRPLLRSDHIAVKTTGNSELKSIGESDEDEFVDYKADQNTSTQANPDSDEFTDFQSYQTEDGDKDGKKPDESSQLAHSSTGDSLTDAATHTSKTFTASSVSSGYGSQAVSIATLSSEDSASVRSLEEVNSKEAGPGAELSEMKAEPNEGKAELVDDGQVDGEAKVELNDGQEKIGKAESSEIQAELNDGQVDDVDNEIKAELSDGQAELSQEKAESSDGQVRQVDSEVVNKQDSSEVKRVDLLADIRLTTPALLMDTKCPSNLGTPLYPLSPQEEKQELPSADNNPIPPTESEPQASQPAEHTTHSTETTADSKQSASEQEEEQGNGEVQESDGDSANSSGKHDISCDMYSENALDELERLDEGLNDTFASPAPHTRGQPVQSSTQNGELDSSFTDNDINVDINPNKPEAESIVISSHNEQKTPVSKEKSNGGAVKLRNNKTRDPQKRSSWADTSDVQNSTIPEDTLVTSSPSSSEVKLRKGGAIDISRPLVVKKGTKTAEGKTKAGVSGGVSPMKATYRPVSMPPEMLALDQEQHSHDEDSDNEDTSSMYSFGSRADLNRLGETPVPSWIQTGEPVQVLFSSGGTKNGTVRFVGSTEFAAGNWVGVELDTNAGKNDGSVNGVRYFKCKKNYGIFKRHDKLIMDKRRRGSKERNSAVRRSTGNLPAATGGGHSNPPATGGSSPSVPSFMKSTSSSSIKQKK